MAGEHFHRYGGARPGTNERPCLDERCSNVTLDDYARSYGEGSAGEQRPSAVTLDSTFTPGESYGEAQARLRLESKWEPVDFGEERGCGHVETMCPACIESWANDYDLIMPCGCHYESLVMRGHNSFMHADHRPA